jgi:hypothetical protein
MTPEQYEAKRAARIDRLKSAATSAQSQSDNLFETAHKMAECIPMGQPILIGHHSEKRDRNYRQRIHNKMDKAVELGQKADNLAGRAIAAERNTSIFSDDPRADEKIAEKVERLEARQHLMKSFNAALRKNDIAAMTELGFSEAQINRLSQPDWCGRKGYADYELTNNNANIRRLKLRLAEVQKKQNDETTEETIGDVRILDNVDDNRLQIFFPGKPSEAVRDELKHSGFHWARFNGAWQRHRSNSAMFEAKRIVAKFQEAI